jgi:N-acetylglucosamine-6-sulfatase
MNCCKKIRKHGVLVLLLAFWFAGFCGPLFAADNAPADHTHPSSTRHPNIVFILTDDMAYYDLQVMPNVQKRLVEEGTSLTNFFVTNSLCCPSRAAILRGQYVHNHTVDRNRGGFQRFQQLGHESSTIATWMKSAGYTTGFMGKYLNGYSDRSDKTHIPPGWDEWNSPIDHRGYREFDYSLNENGKIVSYGHSPNDYLTDVIAHKAVTFIRQAAKTKKPFFLYVAPFAPHLPSTPAPRHEALFPDAKAPRTASFNEKDVSAKPAFIRVRKLLSEQQITVIDQLYRQRIRSLQAVDDLVEQVVETLNQTGDLHNTFIVFTSDNGYHLGQHRLLQGKQMPYEEDIRVPLVIRGPGVPSHHVVRNLAVETDLAPTFAAWASIDPPGFVDGRPLEPLLQAQAPSASTWRQAVLIEHSAGAEPFMSRFEKMIFTEKPQLLTYKGLRTNNFLYVEHSSGERELYDLRHDIDELDNLAAKVERNVIERLSTRLAQLGNCKGIGCRAAEDAELDGPLLNAMDRTKLARHPNIVFILTDDMALHDVEAMPKLKRFLIDEGTTFSNYFVTNSQCCPSRSSILRGQYVHNHNVDSNHAGFRRFYELGHEASTIATWLKAAGYTTAYMGKYLNGYPQLKDKTHVPPGWDEWNGAIKGGGYKQFNYRLNENGNIAEYGHSDSDYLTDVISRKTQAFIRQAVERRKPFFLHLAPFAPHEPATPAPRHKGLFPDAKAPRTASFNEQDLTRKPAYLRALPLLTEAQTVEMDQLYRMRIQSLQAVDDLLEKTVETLKETGELSNTYIVFTSDNGFHLGQHRLPQGKQTAYEEDIHVPLVIRGPGVSPHHNIPHLALETDLAPTFADWASVIPPGFVDGRSLEPLLGKHAPSLDNWRQGVLIEHYPGLEPFMSKFEKMLFEAKDKPRLTPYKAVRSNQYLYVQYESAERELYELRKDPDELHNIVKEADPDLVKGLSSWLDHVARCAGANCRTAENATIVQLRMN